MRRALAAAGVLAAAFCAARAVEGCDGGVPSADASDDARPDARRDGAAPDVDDGAAPPAPCVVDGYWLDDAYDPTCGFCYPQSTASLPPPIQWQACDPTATPAGMTCRQMVEDWPVGQGPFAGSFIAGFVPAWVQSNGTVTVSLLRTEGTNGYWLVADVDGLVHQAIVETNIIQCVFGESDIRDGRVVYRIHDSETAPLSDYGGGSYGANIGDLRPRVYTHYHNDTINDRTYYVSALGMLEVGTVGSYIDLYDWTTGAFVQRLDSALQDNGYATSYVWPRRDAVFYAAYIGTAYNKLRMWTPDGGAADFITYGTDYSQGAGNLGNDGVDMVWDRGSGRTDGGGVGTFPINDVMTSPYTTDPAKLQPRRLCSDGYTYGTNPFVVGCGYAIHDVGLVLSNEVGLLLVRLSDGQSWRLTSPDSSLWIWSTPIALTCTELFAVVQTKTSTSQGHFTVVRVRLDSLGPGLPPN